MTSFAGMNIVRDYCHIESGTVVQKERFRHLLRRNVEFDGVIGDDDRSTEAFAVCKAMVVSCSSPNLANRP